MKYVNFTELKIKNFLSIGNDQVVVDFKKGLHIITGINRDKEDRRNGVGKSTVADALYFAIFGTTLRDIKKNFIANNLTAGTCEVQLTFTVDDPQHGVNEFNIIRTLNPSKCYIYKNGNDKTRDSIVNTNEYIHTVLSSTPEIFQNCVIMTLNNHIPFMGKSKNDKRKFIEQIFNLEVFSKMLNELRTNYNEVKRNFDVEITRLEESNNYLEAQKGHRDTFNTNKNNRIDILKETIEKHKEDLGEANDKLDKINELNDEPYREKLVELNGKLEEKQNQRQDLYTHITESKLNLSNNKEKLSKLGTEEDTCPVCLRPMEDHDHVRIEREKIYIQYQLDQADSDIEVDENNLTLFDEEIGKINKAIKIVEGKISDIEKQKFGKTHVESSIEYIGKCIKEVEDELGGVENETNTFSDSVTELEQKVETIGNELNSIKKVLNLLDVVKFVVSEEGVKSFIVKKILQHFNSKLTYFLKKLDSNCVCMFNEYFEEEIVNEKGKICTYNNFSGAERKAIDLACLFSFMDMRKAQGDVHYNISFYDELFDSSLDEKGVELVLEILNERVEKYNECVFVISHRKESIKAASGDIIFLEKHNGITKRINFVD
jgi:DNA repair exonuclease SbcCD ATPase subunit